MSGRPVQYVIGPTRKLLYSTTTGTATDSDTGARWRYLLQCSDSLNTMLNTPTPSTMVLPRPTPPHSIDSLATAVSSLLTIHQDAELLLCAHECRLAGVPAASRPRPASLAPGRSDVDLRMTYPGDAVNLILGVIIGGVAGVRHAEHRASHLCPQLPQTTCAGSRVLCTWSACTSRAKASSTRAVEFLVSMFLYMYPSSFAPVGRAALWRSLSSISWNAA